MYIVPVKEHILCYNVYPQRRQDRNRFRSSSHPFITVQYILYEGHKLTSSLPSEENPTRASDVTFRKLNRFSRRFPRQELFTSIWRFEENIKRCRLSYMYNMYNVFGGEKYHCGLRFWGRGSREGFFEQPVITLFFFLPFSWSVRQPYNSCITDLTIWHILS